MNEEEIKKNINNYIVWKLNKNIGIDINFGHPIQFETLPKDTIYCYPVWVNTIEYDDYDEEGKSIKRKVKQIQVVYWAFYNEGLIELNTVGESEGTNFVIDRGYCEKKATITIGYDKIEELI